MEFVDEIVSDEFDVQLVAVIVIDALFDLDFGRTELFYLLLCYGDGRHIGDPIQPINKYLIIDSFESLHIKERPDLILL